MSLNLLKHVKVTAILECKTGLRVGGSKEELEIGGTDNPIIRHPITKLPYIPGSSIKGKMRSLLEYRYDKVLINDKGIGVPCGCAQGDCLVCTVFGPHLKQTHNLGPSRLLVRDATLTPESVKSLQKMQEEGLLFAEVKRENIIDRKTGIAAKGGLRTQERIPAGTTFQLRMSVRVFKDDPEQKVLSFIKEGLQLLQDDYLGGSGSRGYGEVELKDIKFT